MQAGRARPPPRFFLHARPMHPEPRRCHLHTAPASFFAPSPAASPLTLMHEEMSWKAFARSRPAPASRSAALRAATARAPTSPALPGVFLLMMEASTSVRSAYQL